MEDVASPPMDESNARGIPVATSSSGSGRQGPSVELAEAAVAALVAEVSKAAMDVASEGEGKSSIQSKQPQQPMLPATPRRVCGFYPARVASSGKRRRDELDVGFAFDIAKKEGDAAASRAPRGSSYSFCEPSGSRRRQTSRSDQKENHHVPIVSMARYVLL